MPDDNAVVFRDVTFRHNPAQDPLLRSLNAHFPRGFTGVIGANGAGKTTLLRLAIGELEAEQGQVQAPADAIYCPQRTEEPPADLDQFLEAYDGDACALRGRLRVEPDWSQRWESLSHGERKRAQIGVALWRDPILLAIDEPTNHIDADAKGLLLGVLQRYGGIGLMVSHDRELLDELCMQCIWLEGSSASLFSGGYTQAAEQRQREHQSAQRERANAKREHDRLRREVARRREQASRSHRERSKRGLARGDSDARAKIDQARVSGKDGQAGRLLRQLAGRSRQAEARLAHARVDKKHELGIWLPGSRSPRSTLFHLEAGSIPLGSHGRSLHFPTLSMKPDERIAIVGPNGTGKTTLLRHIESTVSLPQGKLVSMPQEIEAAEGARILDRARRSSGAELGHVMNVVSRLGSRPARLLESEQPSPGEVRKLLLALGMARAPHLIVMDEPTNHLDLPAIRCLEEALADCPCGLLLVSHDRPFLERLSTAVWQIDGDGYGDSQLTIL